MSTYYALICDKCKEGVHAASWGGGGIDSMGTDAVVPKFLIGHRRCALRVVDEHQHEYDEYNDWNDEDANVDELLNAALDRRLAEELKEPI